MKKKTGCVGRKVKTIGQRVISFVLAGTLTLSLVAGTVISNPQEVEAIGVQDAVENSYTVISGVVNAAQSIQIMRERNNGNMSAADVLSALFSDPSQLKMEYMLEDIYAGVGKIDGKVDKIDEKLEYLIGRNEAMYKSLNSSLNTVNKKLDQQSKTLSQITDTLDNVLKKQISVKNQIESVQESITSQMETAVDTLSTAIYDSTSEIKNFTSLMKAITAFYSSFDGLDSVEQTILKDLKNKQTDYDAFIEAVNALDNGTDIIKVIEKITVNYEESYNALTEEEKELLNIQVTVPGYSKMTIAKFYSDYMQNMYTYMTETIYEKSSGYTSNIYDTSIFMSKYILGQEASTGNIPIGELYYQLSMCTCQTSDEVHKAYLEFRDSVLQQYYTTAYLCEMSLFYMISYEKAHDGNSSEIKTYEEHLDTLYQQMQQIYAYADYEEKNCQLKYDFNGYIDSEYHKYLCYYGNSNNSKKGIKNWKCVPKKDVYISGGLSEETITLAMGETHPLCLYYGVNDVTESATFTSGDTSVAVVGADGTICAVSSGETDITVTFNGKEYVCKVIVGSNIAIPNGTNTSNYHYGENMYSTKADIGYDYYYNAIGYVADQVNLSAEKKAVGIAEVSGLSEEDLSKFNWISATEGVAKVSNNQIYNVDAGFTVIYGYRYLEDEMYYEYIGIPVVSGFTISADLEKDAILNEKKDYSDYVKISTAEDLIELAKSPDKWGAEYKYVLTNDIDLNGMEWSSSIGYMFGIGEEEPCKHGVFVSRFGTLGSVSCAQFVPFCGEFDGNGHTISNFKITAFQHQDKLKDALIQIEDAYDKITGDKSSVNKKNNLTIATLGLFGATQNAKIYNLNVTDAKVSLDIDVTDTIEIDGYELTLKNSSYVEYLNLYAGSMIGYAASKTDYKFEEMMCEIYHAPSMDELVNNIDAYTLDAEQLELYAPNIPENIKNESNKQVQIPAVYLYLLDLCASKMQTHYIENCYVSGNMNTNVKNNKNGSSFSGMFAGCAENSVRNCRTAGIIECSDMSGAAGGLLGKWDTHTSYALYDCTSEVSVTGKGGCVAGGLIGNACISNTAHASYFEFDDSDLTTIDSSQFAMVTYKYLYHAIGGIKDNYDCDRFLRYDDNNQNVTLKNCQVLGNATSELCAGGLIGMKSGPHKACKIKKELYDNGNQIKTTCDISYYNMDISNCYVVSDVISSGPYAGGLIGVDFLDDEADSYVPEVTESVTETKSIKRGSIKRCYYYGNIASTGAAAGVVGMVDYDLLDVSSIIIVPYTISVTVDSKEASLIAPTVFSDAETKKWISVDSNTVYYYETLVHNQYIKTINNVTSYGADDTALGVPKTNADLSKPETYQELWPDAFLELKVQLNPEKGMIPTYLSNRYDFPVEQARKYYIVGDTFEPLTKVHINDGVVSKLVTEGVTCVAPDMSKPGVRQVTVQYGDYSDQYIVYIYPKQSSYIKVTSLPELVRGENGAETLSGGTITIYNNKNEEVEVKDISECTVSLLKDKSKFVISYDNMTTCLGVASLSVYSNGLKTEEAVELRENIRFIEGTKTNRDQILKDIIELPSGEETVRYKLLGSSLEEGDFTVNKDMSVLTLYVSEASLLEHEHDYAASFDWEEDGSGCAVTLICQNDMCGEDIEGYKITDTCTVTSVVKTPATCMNKGTTTYTATYTLNGVDYTDNKEIDDLEKVNHQLIKTDAKAATCVSKGNIDFWTCSGCNQYFLSDDANVETAVPVEKIATEIPVDELTGHNYENGVCSDCDAIFTMTVDGIIYKVVTQTDTVTGKPVGQTIKVSGNDIPQVAVSVIGVDNTFTASGSGGKVVIPSSVTGSGSEQTFVVTKVSENAFSTAEVTEIVVPATITELENGAFGGVATVSFNGNTAPEGIANAITNNATVNVPEGAGESYKSVLGESVTIVEIHTHTFDTKWTYDETYHWHASTCGHEEEIADKAEHTFGDWVIVTEPTCEEKGSITYKCTKCGEVMEVVELAATGHKWDAGKVTKEATETAEGVKTYACNVCGKTKTEVIPKKAATTPEQPKKGDVVADDKASAKVEVADVTKKEVTYKAPANKKAKTVTIPATVKIHGVTYKVIGISDNAFKGNKTVTKVTIGSNIKTIGKNAFSGATKLKKVTIGKNVTEIGANAFKGCSSLTSITLPSNVTKIGANAFSGCKKLKTITIKSTKLSAKNVSKNAFKGLSKNTTIKVPKKKFKEYQKLFRSRGFEGKVKA